MLLVPQIAPNRKWSYANKFPRDALRPSCWAIIGGFSLSISVCFVCLFVGLSGLPLVREGKPTVQPREKSSKPVQELYHLTL